MTNTVNFDPHVVLTEKYSEAVLYASTLHRGQTRKGNDIAYMAHLLGVSSLVLEARGDEDQAIAALLHDAAEDQGGQPTLDVIGTKFGARVAGIVEACSDSLADTQSRRMRRGSFGTRFSARWPIGPWMPSTRRLGRVRVDM